MKTTSVAKEDAQALVDEFLPFATKMLREHREFLPYGGYITSDGEIVHEGATTGEERSISQDLIDILRAAHRDQALAGSIRASCIVYDLFIARPDQDAKTDAIAFEIDHSDNYSRIIIFPYTIEEDGDAEEAV